MPVMIGSRLGTYEVLAPIGGGGEVYRARDSKLNRGVAIKVLPELVAGDSDRLARFEREAHVLAALNHPNIAHIHGLEGRKIVFVAMSGGRFRLCVFVTGVGQFAQRDSWKRSRQPTTRD